jgi:two-component system, chemotaxis family, CheB/CheR fusion protein
MTAARASSLDDLLGFIKESRGFDFTGYKRSSIERRVSKRMTEVGAEAYEDYLDYLELNAGEYVELFNTLLINVTSFFRDPATWEHVAEEVLPQLDSIRDDGGPVRVWCPGCASGEEAYTLAMVLARILGDQAFRARVKIYATDVDEEALDQARHGAYLPRQIENVPPEALERFFERTDQRYVFRKDLRRSVIFGRNDLVQDAPISRIDILSCRNTLMYFTAETQSQILRRFHFAMHDDAVLLLGKSEMLITHGHLFAPVDLKWRLFRKVIKANLRERARVLAVDPADGASHSISEALREAALDTSPHAQIVLDRNRTLVMANSGARRLLSLEVNDFGRPLYDLKLSYRPLELGRHLDILERDRQAVQVPGVPLDGLDGGERMVDVRMAPLVSEDVLLGVSVTYQDVTDVAALQNEITKSRHELESAYDELQSTVEELETTNEELQSTNEELETTNEELQSTNEELETTNEELQSSNEELETMNDELRHRTLEVGEMNSFLETILTTIGLAVAVIDRRQCVQIWNGQARQLWGLDAEDVADQPLLGLDIGLPVDQLRKPIRACLTGESEREELTLEAVNRRGRSFTCRVVCLSLGAVQDDGEVGGVILMMEPLEA